MQLELSGARLARAMDQRAYERLEAAQVKLAGHYLETASLRLTEIGARKPFKAVARAQTPLGPPS